MLYGLVGSSGVGKTTLATSLAESLGITFLPTSITACAKKHGFNAVGVLSLAERIQLQCHLLSDHLDALKATAGPVIVDRTPIDFIAYMLAEFDMHSHMRATAEEIKMAEEYVHLCLDAAVKHYDFLFILGQLDSYEVSAIRPADNRAYQTHCQFIMQGALSHLQGRISYAVVNVQDRESRHDIVHDIIVQRLDTIDKERRSSPHVH